MKDINSKTTNVTTYWTPLRDPQSGTLFGAVGLFKDYKRFENCMPQSYTEAYFAPTYMMIIDYNL
jgi:hypothetical protein